jgi:hypothetical protein
MGTHIHHILSWLDQNFVPVWKATSIFFTGAFGILGLLKNFKEKKRDPETDTTVERVTKWGWISLIGIILSTGLGIAAQRTEENSNRKKAAEDADKIDRLLSPTIEGIQFSTRYNLPCKKAAWDCEDLRKRIKANEKLAEVNREWALTVDFFLDQKDAESFIAGKDVKPNLEYSRLLDCVVANASEEDPHSDIIMVCENSFPDSNPTKNDGNVRDAISMQRAICLALIDTWGGAFLSDGRDGAEVLNLELSATLKDNRKFDMKRPPREVTTKTGKLYMGSLQPAEAKPQSAGSSAAPSPH